MDKEIIDLTVTPPPVYIDVDAEEPLASASTLTTDTGSAVGPERERKKSRRKKRKRTLTEGESQSSTAQTREHSVEEGEIDSGKPRERLPTGSSSRPIEEHHRRKERHLNEQNQHRRSPSPSVQKPSPTKDAGGLFFIDVAPALLPPTALFASTSNSAAKGKPSNALLLPAHVSVFGTEPVEILLPATADSDEEDYIDYLDFDDRVKNATRYFESSLKETNKSSRTVCKNCKAEGEHTTASCPVLICLTCGARNEHGTRSCPISKTCFTCGMKGHVNATCPNRRAARRGEINRYDDCDRCGSEFHKTNECPTLWRLYDYLTEEARKLMLQTRKQKQRLNIGEGGEGYIADDEWCYNCGSCGHWGDDCQDLPHRDDLPNEFSAFSEHSTLSGPFSDMTMNHAEAKSRRREPRDWELTNDYPASWGNVPENVGRQGRRNNAAKMERKAQEQAAEDDPDDWFGNPKNARNRGVPQTNGTRSPKKITFGKSIQESSRHFQPPSPPSLLERLGDSYRGSEIHSKRHRSGSIQRPRKSDHGHSSHSRHDDRYRPERDRERDWRRRDDSGPRYRGGYLR
ncbi:hypothetical protein D9615_000391 [Tricholomella constricta]|uniref:CCHC-type domain-containing protein n=1 Tax=Tricholomella constricta TaxID=117010 RepID=A0A8H5MB60_9AGAR|nr:hypothetical protein D9615_000391 [Tricholomella constricta]